MTDDEDALRLYYDRRASEHEQVYHRPDPSRQAEQKLIATAMREVLAERVVLEIACGTGFWTAVAAQTARRIVATDCSDEMLAIAQAKPLPQGKVEFRKADAYHLDAVAGEFDAALANFWLSHVPRARVEEFLSGLHRWLARRAPVFMADNVFIPDVGGELIPPEGSLDTYKLRRLADGSTHRVLKNYYAADHLRAIFERRASDLRITVGKCFWWLSYKVL